MTLVEVTKKGIEKLLKKSFSLVELEEFIFEFGIELEESSDEKIHLDITSDRPDLLSLYGLARSLNKYLSHNPGLSEYKIEDSGISITVNPNLSDIRPYVVACLIKDIQIDEEILEELIRVQEKLHDTYCRKRKTAAIGIYPFKNIKPPLKYIAVSPEQISFTPLGLNHDMNGSEILENHETGQKYSDLLKNFQKYPLLLDSNNHVLSMPPIINSEDFGQVKSGKQDIFIEVTGTNLVRIKNVLNILSSMMVEMGGKLFSVDIKYNQDTITTPDISPQRITLQRSSIEDVLGIELEDDNIIQLLERMGYGIETQTSDQYSLLVPYYRADVLHEIDVIDDIIRAYGMNNLKPILPTEGTIGRLLKKTVFVRNLRQLLIGAGYTECFTFALSSFESQVKNMSNEEALIQNTIDVPNAKAGDINLIRKWILPELFKCLKENESYPLPMKLFEINDICTEDLKTETGYRNLTNLSILITGNQATFTDSKQILEHISKIMGMNYILKEGVHPSFIKGRTGIISHQEERIGIIGEISPTILEKWKWSYPVSCLEVNLDCFIGNKIGMGNKIRFIPWLDDSNEE